MLVPHTTQFNDPTSGLDAVNCTCGVGATGIKWHYRNVRPTSDPEFIWPPTAGNVRALVVEPDGDPDLTGGTNFTQVADAIRKGWQVPMEVYTGNRALPFDDAWELAQDPDVFVPVAIQYSVIDGTRLDAGGTFLGAHAGGIANAGRNAADWTDPLADGRRPGIPEGIQRIPKALLREACGELITHPWTTKEPWIRRAGDGWAWCAAVRAVIEKMPADSGGDVMFNIGPSTTHRDAVLKAGAVLYRDGALTVRQSAVTKETRLGFLGSTAEAHVVVNAGKSNYVKRADVTRIVANERTFE